MNNGTILHTAILQEGKNTDKIVEDIVNSGFDVNLTDWSKETPIFYPVKNASITKLLLEHKAKINVKGDFGIYPIHSIVRDETVESVQLLIQYGADINAKDDAGNTPLHYCGSFYNNAYCQKGTIIAYLISAGAQINAKNKYGNTPLHIFASGMFDDGSIHNETLDSGGNTKGVELMIKAGADVNARDNKGRTPLHFAVECGNMNVVRLLLNHGAKKDAKMNDGTKPFMIASKYSYQEIEELLK